MPKCPRKVPQEPLPGGLGIIGRASYSHTSSSDRPGRPLAVTLGETATHSPGKLREAIQLVTWRGGSQPRCARDVRVPLASEVSRSQQCGCRTPQGGCDSRPGEGPCVATAVGQPGVPQSSEGADGGSVGMGKGPWEPWQSIRDGGAFTGAHCLAPAASPRLQEALPPGWFKLVALPWSGPRALTMEASESSLLARAPCPTGCPCLPRGPTQALHTQQYLQIFFVFINVV